MKTVNEKLDLKIEEFLGVVESEVEHLGVTLGLLNDLRECVIKRDDKGLGRLLESVRGESDKRLANEFKRNLLRDEIGELLGCEGRDVTLSRLEGLTGAVRKEQISSGKKKLIGMTKHVQKEHFKTVSLLCEFSRLNNLMMNKLFEKNRGDGGTYSASGQKRQSDLNLMNFKF